MSRPRPTLRRFVDKGLIKSDRGRPLGWSPLLDALSAYERPDVRSLALCCPRRSGKSSAAAAVSLHHALTTPNAFVLWVAATGGSVESIFEQKLSMPLRYSPEIFQPRHSSEDEAGDHISRTRVSFGDTGSVIQCVAPSEAAAVGKTLTLLIVDECRLVEEEIIRLLEPSTYGTGKRIYIGTAGRPGSWWHRLFTHPEEGSVVRTFASPAEAQNPGLDVAAEVEAARRRAERSTQWERRLFAREWSNEWTTLDGQSLVSWEDVAAASVADVRPFEPGKDVAVVGVDLSTVGKDLTSIVTVAKDREGAMRVVDVEAYRPDDFHGDGVSFDLVEAKLLTLHRRYRPRKVVLDRHQGHFLAQRLRRAGVPLVDLAVTAPLNQSIFASLAEAMTTRRLSWAANDRLEAEVRGLTLEETAGGFRVLDADKRYHRDLAFSLALAVWQLSEVSYFVRETTYCPSSDRSAVWPQLWRLPTRSAAEEAAIELRKVEERYERELGRLSRGRPSTSA